MKNNNEIKRMQELAGIKSDNNKLPLSLQQIYQNSIKREKKINNLMELIIKERKNVNNRKY